MAPKAQAGLVQATCLVLLCGAAVAYRIPPYHGIPKAHELPPKDIQLNYTTPVVTFNATMLDWKIPPVNETLLNLTRSHEAPHSRNTTVLAAAADSFLAKRTTIAAKPLDAPIGGASTAVTNVGMSSTAVPNTAQSYTGASSQDAINLGNYEQPPDQALCVSPDWVYEVVNGAVAIYDAKTGAMQSITAISAFFTPPTTSGIFVFDPRCVYDESTGAVFFVATTFDPNTGGLDGYLLIQAATPTAANPLAGATTHIQLSQDRTNFPTTGCQDTAGNPVACPVGAGCNGVTLHCWGDYPTLAVDNTFLWTSVNIFTAGPLTTSPNTYLGNMAYALDKAAILGSASPVPTFMIDLTNFGFTTQPAITQARRRILTPFPPLLYDPQMFGSTYPTTDTSQEVMYFTTAVTAAVCIAAIPNAPTLLTGGTVAYVQLCRALDYQDVGSNAMVPTPGGVNIGPIDSRMQQTPYMQGTLWGALNSLVTVGGVAQFGVAYFKTQGLSFTSGVLDFTIGAYGYLGLTGIDVSNPAIAPFPTEPETAAIAVGVGGTSMALTFGYSIINTQPGVGLASTIHLVSTSGQLTNDGVDRYGDYTAAVASPDGSVWVAGMSSLPVAASNGQENWNTWITQVILPPVARCAASVTLTATAGACTDTITSAALTTATNNGTTSPGGTLTLDVIVSGAVPVAGSYSLAAGQSYPITLFATNAAGQSTCQTTVTVTAVPKPTALCKNANYNSPNGGPVDVTSAALLAAIDNGSHSNGGNTITETLSPPADANGQYSLAVGASPFTLTVSNCAGTDSCTATVTVTRGLVSTTIPTTTNPPSTTPRPGPCNAVCKHIVELPATSQCAAQLTSAQLFAAIDNGSSGSPVLTSADPSVPTSSSYSLPIGAHSFDLTCNVTDRCTAVIDAVDLEPLSASNISCGALPTAGVLVTSLLTVHDSFTPAATYTPSYTKANGCPVSAVASGMDCSSCRLGGSVLTNLNSNICRSASLVSASGAVTVSKGQVGRVAWTVTAQDALNSTVTGRCAVCVDHGDFGLTTLGACPRPFTATTPCNAGQL